MMKDNVPTKGDNSAILQTAQTVAIGAASAPSSAVGTKTDYVILTPTSACWVAFGTNPTAAVGAAGSMYLPANFPSPPIQVAPGETKIAVIQQAAAGSLSIAEFGFRP